MRTGVIGLGDMGSGLAKNLIANGFETSGYDLSAERMATFSALGGHARDNPAEVGSHADIVYVMVMNGAQVHEVVMGADGLASTMPSGGSCSSNRSRVS